MQKTVDNGTLIVEALEKFKSNEGSYPDKLIQLVPKYLSSIPRTEICCTPDFRYRKLENGKFKISVFYGFGFRSLIYDSKKILTAAKREGNWAFVID